MRNLILGLVLFVSLTGCANHNPREWTKQEIKKEVIFQGLNVIDFALTGHLLRDSRFSEANPIIGPNPKNEELIGWCVGTGVLHYLATDYFINYDSPTSVAVFQNSTIIYKAGVVGWNLHWKF